MRPINHFLLQHGFTLATNPCVSPDFCLDWPRLSGVLRAGSGGSIHLFPQSGFATKVGRWELLEERTTGDRAWRLTPAAVLTEANVLSEELRVGEALFYPASWENLLRLKNLIQEYDPTSTIFPRVDARTSAKTLGIGARFTTLHWAAVEWAMAALDLGVTANQNSIPRELVFDVDEMLAGRLARVPFPFIGTSVPEGHQGQSVEGMSHGAVLSKLETGFHRRGIPWNFNADHQPIGGAFDSREGQLVVGCALANYITFDLSPELSLNRPAKLEEIDANLIEGVRVRLRALGLAERGAEFDTLLMRVWPALKKMEKRDGLYRAKRAELFTTDVGRAYIRELSIDELPGRTTPETTAVMLSLCEQLGMPVSFVAPAFGFQKNLPFPDNAELHRLVEAQWRVCQAFGASIGFHSGSGKSAENYRILGAVTGGRLEIKTSGRYTYEMGRALAASTTAADQTLWKDWYAFTRELALGGAFSEDPTERSMARSFITATLPPGQDEKLLFSKIENCRIALEALKPDPEHVIFFEYNFLFVLAADGRADKAALGDHGVAGYRQRARFYAISPEARLRYSRAVASYIIFLAETTGLADPARCAAASNQLKAISRFDEFIGQIAPDQGVGASLVKGISS